MIESIDTNSNFADKEIPDGIHSFRVLGFRKHANLYIFPLSYDDGQEGEQVFFGNQMGEFLKCMGCEESKKGIYIFDSDKVIGGSFKATVYREVDKKDSSKIYQRMKNFDELPF
jgi:hypothetical protein